MLVGGCVPKSALAICTDLSVDECEFISIVLCHSLPTPRPPYYTCWQRLEYICNPQVGQG